MAMTGPRPGSPSGVSAHGPISSAPTPQHKENHSMTGHSLYRLLGKTRVLAAGALALLGCLLTPTKARAQFGLIGGGIVFDPSNFARNVLHYARRLQQMALQKQQLQQQLAAMRKLPNPPWRDIRQTVAQLDGLMADGRALSYRLRNLDQQFQATFPVNRTFHNWPSERRTQAARTV